MRNGIAIWVVLAVAGELSAQTVQPGFGAPVQQGGGNINSGTSMAFAPDGRLFVAQQTGEVRVIKNGALLATPFLALTVNSVNERGLLGIAFDPDYPVNRFFYVFYTLPAVDTNRVARYVASSVNADIRDAAIVEDVLLDIPTGARTPQYHNGGALHFGPDGKLYIAVGEGHQSANAQNPANIYGKILRLNPDGSIPSDNPTTFQGTMTTLGAPSAVWCIGLRNPFTFAFQPGTGRMFINDVGQDEWEEINDGLQGMNYGWNGGTTDGVRVNPLYTDSVYEYHHSTTTPFGNVITGGAFYNPGVVAYPASYVGRYFFADVGTGNFIYVLNPANGTVAPFVTGALNPVDLDVGPDGALYFLARGGGSQGVYRVPYTAVATQGIVISTEALSVSEGLVGGFNVRLAVNPGATVVVNVAQTLGDASVTVTPPTLTFTGGTWNVDQPVTVTAAQDVDLSDDGATISLSSAGLPTRSVAVTALDNDDDLAMPPAVRIAQPINGQTVSGANAEFYGHATDDSGSTGAAQFFVDGVLSWTDPNVLGHYHYGAGHATWNTTGLSNGPHVLQMRVTDGTNVGIHEITVIVSNATGGGGGGGGGGCGLTGWEALALLILARCAQRRKAAAGSGCFAKPGPDQKT